MLLAINIINVTDTVSERRAVSEHVFPQLRSLCANLGLHFLGLDLLEATFLAPGHPGEESSEDIFRLELEGVFELVVKEIKLCQENSSGPAFVVCRKTRLLSIFRSQK